MCRFFNFFYRSFFYFFYEGCWLLFFYDAWQEARVWVRDTKGCMQPRSDADVLEEVLGNSSELYQSRHMQTNRWHHHCCALFYVEVQIWIFFFFSYSSSGWWGKISLAHHTRVFFFVYEIHFITDFQGRQPWVRRISSQNSICHPPSASLFYTRAFRVQKYTMETYTTHMFLTYRYLVLRVFM